MKSINPRPSARLASGYGRWKMADGFQLESLSKPFTDSRSPTSDLRSPATRYQSFVNLHLQIHESFQLPPSTPRASREAAFSLTEVVIALGIFAISMVGVLALFPVASATGRESSEETQAAILAQTIIDDLANSAERRGFASAYVVRGPNTINTGDWLEVDLKQKNTYYAAYDVARRTGDPLGGIGMQGDPIALKATNFNPFPAHWTTGSGVPAGVAYLTRVEVQPQANFERLSQVIVTVETPATVASSNRRSFVFSALLQGQ